MKKFILSAYILYLPFQLKFPDVLGLNLINTFLILLVIILMTNKEELKVKTSFELPLILFLIVWVISLFNTIFTIQWVWQWEIVKVFKRIFTLVIGYFVFSCCIKSKAELRFYLRIFLISLILVGIHTWRNGVLAGPNFADFKRSSGPFGEIWKASDIAGGFLAMFTPLLLAYSLFSRKKMIQIIGFIGFLICLFGIMATYSRGSMLAFVFAIVVIVLFTLKHLPKLTRISTMAIVLIVIGGILSWKAWVPRALMTRIEKTATRDQLFSDEVVLDDSSEGRIEIWKSGLEIVKINPILGIGFKKAEYIMQVDPHNSYILILAEMGVFGLLFFLLFLLGVLKDSFFLLKTEFIGMGIGFLGLIVALLAVNMFYSNFFRDTVSGSLWVSLGLLTAGKKIALADNKK